jgi:hypothetical protein
VTLWRAREPDTSVIEGLFGATRELIGARPSTDRAGRRVDAARPHPSDRARTTPRGRDVQIDGDDIRAVRASSSRRASMSGVSCSIRTGANLEIDIVDRDGNRDVISQDKGGRA